MCSSRRSDSVPGRSGPQSLLADAEQLIAGTADAMNPATPAPVLLACLAQYRAYLVALVTACQGLPRGDGQCFFGSSSDSEQDHI